LAPPCPRTVSSVAPPSGLLPEVGSDRRGDAVAFRVEVVADFDGVARLPLVVVLVHRRLEQEGVLALGVADLEDAGLGRRHEHVRTTAHERPHLGERRYPRVLHAHTHTRRENLDSRVDMNTHAGQQTS